RDVGELLCEILDGAMHDRRCLGVLADQHGVKDLLADVFGWLLSEGIFTRFAKRLSPSFENVPEGALAGAVSQKSFLVLQFNVEPVNPHRRQARGTVRRNTGYLLVRLPCPMNSAADWWTP